MRNKFLSAGLPSSNRSIQFSSQLASGVSRFTVSGLLTTLTIAVVLALGGMAQAEPQHGVSLGGKSKYPKGFSHYSYANPKAPKGGKLIQSSPINFDTLNPFSLKGRGAPLIGLLFETLTDHAMDEPFTVYGLVAETIDIAKDNLSVTFNINPKARFSDGKPITAEDVAFTYKLLISDAASPFYRYYYADVKSVQVLNKRKVKFLFTRKNRELALILSELPVLPRHFYSGKDFGKDYATKAMGSGPYLLDGFEFGKYVRYKRNPKYWGSNLGPNVGRNNFDKLEVKIYRDQTAEFEGFKAGEFDFLSVNSSKRWAVDIKGKKWNQGWIVKDTLKHQNTAGMQGYIFNLRKPIFKQREVRQALALAFDFEWSNRSLFYGQYTSNDSYFDNSELAAEGLPDARELKMLNPLKGKIPADVFTVPMGQKQKPEPMRTRLRKAARLLKKAGWSVKDGVLTQQGTGLQMRFVVTLISPAFERITEPFLNNLKKLGVQTSMKVVDSAVYEKVVRTLDYDMIVNVFGQSQSPGNEQMDYWGTASADKEGSRNRIGIKDPAVDSLVEAIIAAKSRKALVTATHALDRVLWHGHYVVPHWFIETHRVTYWNKFGYPPTPPKNYQPESFLLYWWEDPARAAALKKAVSSNIPIN